MACTSCCCLDVSTFRGRVHAMRKESVGCKRRSKMFRRMVIMEGRFMEQYLGVIISHKEGFCNRQRSIMNLVRKEHVLFPIDSTLFSHPCRVFSNPQTIICVRVSDKLATLLMSSKEREVWISSVILASLTQAIIDLSDRLTLGSFSKVSMHSSSHRLYRSIFGRRKETAALSNN